MSDQSVYTTMYTVSESYLVIQGQVTEGRDVLGPLHQHQKLLFHGLANIRDGGDLFGADVAVQDGRGGADLNGSGSSQHVIGHSWLLMGGGSRRRPVPVLTARLLE